MSKEKTPPQIKIKKKRQSANNSFKQALSYHLAGDLASAEGHYRTLLNAAPEHPDAQYHLGALLAQCGKIDSAKIWFKKVLHENPGQAQYWLTYAESHMLTGQPGEALIVLEQAKSCGIEGAAFEVLRDRVDITLAQQPALAEARQLFSQGRLDEALAHIESQIKVLGERVEFLQPMAEILLSKGLLEKALPYAKALSARLPEDWRSWNIHGDVLRKLGRFKDAYPCFERALALNPGEPDVVMNSAANFHSGRAWAKTIERIQPLVDAQPTLIRSRAILAQALMELQRVDEARPLVEVLAREGCYTEELYRAHGRLLLEDGDLSSVIDLLQKGKNSHPMLLSALTNLRAYDPHSTPEMIKHEAMLFGDWLAKEISSDSQLWHFPAKGGRLRVGFVSADFGPHTVGRFLVPSLTHLPQQEIELFAYSSVEHTDKDPVRVKLKAIFDHWANIEGMSDAQAAQMIHDDHIQILIDLGGHTRGNRLGIFQRRPAPVQATWLGFPTTTGVKNIDYFLCGAYQTPPEEEEHFTEKVWRIPGFGLCFSAPDLDLQVNALPSLTSQSFTFGCLNNQIKITDRTVSVWAKILCALPHARLLLKVKGFKSQDNIYIQRTKNSFIKCGVSAERLIFEDYNVPRHDFIASYQQVDIALDPFPYPGATTSLESLWMGVPVLTMRGYNVASHIGEAIARAAGMPEWIAEDEEDYVEKACKFAVEIEQLAVLRSNLRTKLLASPICNSPLFAKNFGQSLWAMWQK
jgi:protein O-GlcNAc transferase